MDDLQVVGRQKVMGPAALVGGLTSGDREKVAFPREQRWDRLGKE